MSFHAYMVRCADGSYYTGHTDELERRIPQHNSGAIEGYTQKRRPVELVWSQDFSTRYEALAAERQIKGWSRAKKEALIAGDWNLLHELAIPPSERALRLRSGRTEVGNSAPLSPEHDHASPTPVRAERSRSTPAPVPSARNNVDAPVPTYPPLIVLVRPQLAENIGKAARAMLNFGLTELRLVTPRDGWPNPLAGPAASGADVVLADAKVYATTADAVADCTHVYATTVRKRGVTKPVVTPEAAARAIHAEPGRTAILFGAERSGLDTEDVALARTILTVPINPAFGSLNLAQAVILVAYEWSKHQTLAQPPAVDLDPPAPQEELEGMIAQLDAMLVAGGFYHPPDRTPTTRRTLRTLLTKPGWSAQEVRTMRGVLSALNGAKQSRT